MKKLTALLMIALLALSFIACGDDEGDNIVDPPAEQEGIVGVWVSEGQNVAPLLVSLFKVTKITATFNENGTYEVVQVDSANTSLTLTGTYSVEESATGDIYTITANQQSPATLTSEGIYEITTEQDPDVMKYEVVQTSPSIGATPPTPAAGFGSTNSGALGTANVQYYVRQ